MCAATHSNVSPSSDQQLENLIHRLARPRLYAAMEELEGEHADELAFLSTALSQALMAAGISFEQFHRFDMLLAHNLTAVAEGAFDEGLRIGLELAVALQPEF